MTGPQLLALIALILVIVAVLPGALVPWALHIACALLALCWLIPWKGRVG